MVGWFYVMSDLVGLFYAEINSKIMVHNYIQLYIVAEKLL